jgi:UDP-N-acetylmuramoyl-L-alanyl-D-glutamate--2,6-diaminopimelate ligase
MLKKLGVKVAYMGTIGFFCGEETTELPNTVPEILDLYTLLLEALEKDCTHVVMEVSSHALAEKRVEGLEFTAAAFTNLTEDHLDFHKTMENYSMTKALILQQLKDDGSVIVNNDDEYADIFKKKNYITIGFKDSNFTILSYQNAQNATVINFKYKDTEYIVNTGLRCLYNIYNYMTALAILVNLGYDINKILTISQNLTTPKGRCQLISVKDALAVVDYAHTPDAVDKIISAFSENKKGKIITIVGCGGDRDSMKRAIMGKIASEKSDYVIFTSDNPRTENPQKILDDIVQGAKQSNYQVEADRVKAIAKGLDMLERDDVLLILGKGHENYQIIGNTKYHLDDAEEVEKYIDSKNRA